MTGIYLAGHALHARTWRTVLTAPYRDWITAWHVFDLGGLVPAFVRCAPIAVVPPRPQPPAAPAGQKTGSEPGLDRLL